AYLTGRTYKRNYNTINESCSYAEEIADFSPQVGFVNGYFHNYYGSDLKKTTEPDQIADLQLEQNSVASGDLNSGRFTNKVHKGALWFKKDMSDDREI